MKKFKKDLIALSFMISIAISIIFYKLLNNGDGNINSLVTNLDGTIPFLKIFILPYITWYAYIAIGLIYLCMKNRKKYYISLISLNIGIAICYIIYAVFQTTVPRPIVTNLDILSKLVTIIYKYDNPFNCFPSMHVTTTYILMKGINHTKNSTIVSLIFNIIGILIIISTQFVKQHVILDLVFAILLSEVIFRFTNNAKREYIATMKNRLSSIWIIKRKLKNPS
ncbi:phosphatase PAP2 family protein [Clostridium tagluense]|uniref:phosphatase PAP2 family protein n=1 Tax=Clostridium tagluense TaxID=360422 RepID=UPI001CF196A4|nr:phosphatase PAP2 family protein [Clostridium tagluense]MCB2313119.1 phosphatase PAP2 family protein [Clostridium tagluense]MCB2317885.1 phosphatase PAP2 family protein [Clostridium tagluense]MCB2322670.1 phosphatase PAP2 family protein [Clostridium tagluense]MCB2327676.1 phosphatase PAP2 family protein [Clostridium tagluense]MCB2332315.1 phosphatase PAP2 family protein [Clostridium tagluense]